MLQITSKSTFIKRGCHSQNNISQFLQFHILHALQTRVLYPTVCTVRPHTLCSRVVHLCTVLYSLLLCVLHTHTLCTLCTDGTTVHCTHIFTFTLYNYSVTQHTRVQELFNAIPTTEQETV